MKINTSAAAGIFIAALALSTPSRADIWGGDVAVLTQILSNALQQLAQLESVVSNTQDTLGLMREINRGINDSLSLAQSAGINVDSGIFKNIKTAEAFTGYLAQNYGEVVNSPDRTAQFETDQVASEGVNMNKALYEYAKDLDLVGEDIKHFSHAVSPGGAAKLTAQSLGVMIHIMNQQLRATATGLKISSQALALQNKKEKSETAEYLKEAKILKTATASNEISFEFPRF